MKQLDVIMLTNTNSDAIYNMTTKAIDSLRKSSDNDVFNVILMESNTTTRNYNVDKFIKPDEKFNYNKFLNIAIQYCNSDYICISNNDVFFHKNWWEKMLKAMIDNNLDTASPKSTVEQKGIVPRAEIKHRFTPLNKIVEGHHVVYTFCGWCWVMKKEIKEWLFPLDEQFSFFYQDNDVIMRLQERNCKHALIGGSLVDHYGQSSHKILHDQGTYLQHTFNLEKKFIEKWKDKMKNPS
jgi:GT2 family glycosyltransferase